MISGKNGQRVSCPPSLISRACSTLAQQSTSLQGFSGPLARPNVDSLSVPSIKTLDSMSNSTRLTFLLKKFLRPPCLQLRSQSSSLPSISRATCSWMVVLFGTSTLTQLSCNVLTWASLRRTLSWMLSLSITLMFTQELSIRTQLRTLQPPCSKSCPIIAITLSSKPWLPTLMSRSAISSRRSLTVAM